MSNDHDGLAGEVWMLTMLVAVVISVIIGESVIERWHVWWMTESGAAIIVGLIIGGGAYATVKHTNLLTLEHLEFNPEFFTLLLLPPIIFESGYNLNHFFFFSNLGGILLYAFAGTIINFLLIGFALALLALDGYRRVSLLTFVVPLLALAVPILDTGLSILRRIRTGQPIFLADRLHMHHRLLESEGSPRSAVIQFYVLTGAFMCQQTGLVELFLLSVSHHYWLPKSLFKLTEMLPGYPSRNLCLQMLLSDQQVKLDCGQSTWTLGNTWFCM